ncbi:hypothetical protein IT157_10295 [bacterium]|nr:hypothetical protein [bacterium]
MTRLITLLIAFLLAQSAFAQAPDTLWTRTYGGSGFDQGTDLLVRQGGGYLLSGSSSLVGQSNINFWAVATDLNGQVVWDKRFGGSNIEWCHAVCEANDSEYLLAGYTRSFGAQGADGWVVKVNASGDSVWSARFGGISDDLFTTVIKANDGGYILAGGTTSYGAGAYDFYVVKINSLGSVVWTKTYGGGSTEVCYSACQESNGNLIFAGVTYSFGSGGQDFWVLKTTANGDSIWSRTLGGSYHEQCETVRLSDEGDVIASGYTTSFASGQEDFWLTALSSDGDSLWSKSHGMYNGEVCNSIVPSSDGGYLLAGFTTSIGAGNGDFWILKTDDIGDSLWSKTIGVPAADDCYGALQLPDGGYLLVGYTNYDGGNVSDMWLVKTQPDPAHSRVIQPNGTEFLTILSNYNVAWTGPRFDGGVTIALNRRYPVGLWEVITDSTENDGEYAWFVTDPLSDSCRIRICAVQDTFCDISDGNFSIVSSQGYLALVRSSAPNSPVLNWNAGVTECPASKQEWFRLKNFGSEAVVVFQPLEPPSGEFYRSTACGSFFALAPNQMSACSLSLSFQPTSDGMKLDTLSVQTDAVNGVGGYVKIPLSGEQISTPASPEVGILPQDEDVTLYWSVVDTSLGGCAVSVQRYLVFYSPSEAGPFYYHGWTAGTSYTHVGVVTYAQSQFYQVVATDVPAAVLANLREGMEMGEAMGKIENRKMKIEMTEKN